MESKPAEEEKQIEGQEVVVPPGKELDLRRLKKLMKDTTDQFEQNQLQSESFKQHTRSNY